MFRLSLALSTVLFTSFMSNAAETNPLLEKYTHAPFDRIKPEHVGPAADSLLAEAVKKRNALSRSRSKRTYDNTLGALEDIGQNLYERMGLVGIMESVASTPELRDEWNKVLPKLTEFGSSVSLDGGIWRAVKAFAATEEAKALTGARKRFLEKTIKDFERNGAALTPAKKKRLSAIDVELSTITNKFSENVLDSTKDFEMLVSDEKDLAGLPTSAVEAAQQSAEQKKQKGWRFSLAQPSYTAVITYMDNASMRERMWKAFNTRAAEAKRDNRPLIGKIVALRRERAALLGYKTFADYTTELRMARTGGAALGFLERLETRTKPWFDAERDALLAFRRELEGANAPALQAWDVNYYSEKLRVKRFAFDAEALRPWFPMESAMSGMFLLAERLYGVKITRTTGVPVWDKQVEYYEMREADGTLLGGFYADWFPRENKRPGAWMNPLHTGGPRANSFEPHVGMIAGNMTPPVGDKPSLLTLDEVETLFHEFGHLMHHMLSRVEVKSLAGTNVAWDFVELPSQIMENFCWEREVLDLFARHYETKEPIPAELFEKVRKARTFMAATFQMRQLSFGTTDLLLHTSWDAKRDGDAVDFSKRVMQRFTMAPLPDYYSMLTSFSHLFGDATGYAGGYYSYKWSEMLDADAFSKFREGGFLSPQVGKSFRDSILSQGDSVDPAQLFRNFMGRDPDPEAMMQRLGLSKQ
jgi:oligopeptidase A